MRTISLLVVAMLALSAAATAQPNVAAQVMPAFQSAPAFQSGARVSYLNNRHHTQANVFCCAECGTFSDGTGSGYLVELFAEMPTRFMPELSFTLALGASDKGGAFGESTTDNLPIQDPNTGAYVPLVRDHAYTARLRYGSVVPGVRYQPVAEYPVYVSGGIEIEIPFGTATTYTQTESIRSPSGVLYPETNTQTRTVGSGVISGVGMSYAARGTLGYRLPMTPTLDIAPELSYSYPLTEVESAFHWRVTSIAAGVALRWHRSTETPDTIRPATPPVLAKHIKRETPPSVKLAVVAGTPPLRVIETTVTETFPILPYIFFDSASDALPTRLLKLNADEARHFDEANLPHRSLESYYSILNIVGSRLRADPKATLTINGTTDGREVSEQRAAGSEQRSANSDQRAAGSEQRSANSDQRAAGRELARARASRVRDYLAGVWHIAPQRLHVTTTDLPINPSSTEYAEGFAENRRVELSSDNDELLKPIVHERFREETAQPKVIPLTFSLSAGIAAPAGMAASDESAHWQLTVTSHGRSIITREGSGAPPAQFAWRPEDGDMEGLARGMMEHDSLDVAIDVTSTTGEHSVARVPLAAGRTVNPYELSRLSLIVFDFDQATPSDQNARMVSRFVERSIYPASTSTIVGSTDNLGELDHNEKLSQARAMNVADLVLHQKPDAKISRIEGIGPSNPLYDNALPEGRYYCRTVKMEVETPLEAVLPK
jgi:outer membrane protein OmpA-like peptidoglycan-associated protein